MEFVGILWKNNIQKAYLPKTSILKQIVSETFAQLCSNDSIQILLNWTRFITFITKVSLVQTIAKNGVATEKPW